MCRILNLQMSRGYLVDLDKHPKMSAWAERVKAHINDYEKANGEGTKSLGKWMSMGLKDRKNK